MSTIDVTFVPPVIEVEGITNGLGGIALWIGFAATVFSTIVFTFLTYIQPVGKRSFHYLTTLVNAIGALAYLTMALGNTELGISGTANDGVRDRGMMWIRYADRAFSNSLILVILALLAGTNVQESLFTVFLNLLFVGATFAGAVALGYNATWPLFAFGVAAFVPIAIALLGTFRTAAAAKGEAVKSLYTFLAVWTLVIMSADIIIWGTAEGGKVESPDQEVIVYTTFDVAAKCIFGFILLFARSAIEKSGTIFGSIQQETTPAVVAANGKSFTLNIVSGAAGPQLVVSSASA